ncbi:hypothetical protein [Streptomyces sp. NPDC051921]|uniref:hypothetical protein n=1 Tax=Streptomyces sp. NPDC051921 TaxID=3155806 RepID=UPI00342E703D
MEQLRRPIPEALWDELRAERLIGPGTPVPVTAPVGEEPDLHMSAAPGPSS